MTYDYELTLIKQTFFEDEICNQIPKEVKTDIYCGIKSIGRNEFYTADGEDNFITDEHMFDNLNIWTDYQSGTLDINKVVGLPSSLK